MNPYRDIQIKLMILNCLVREDKPMILNHIAKKIRHSPQSVSYQLNQMVDSGILLKDNGHYHPQEYFLNKNMFSLFYDQIEHFVLFIKGNTNDTQMKDDNIVQIFRMFIELYIQNMLK